MKPFNYNFLWRRPRKSSRKRYHFLPKNFQGEKNRSKTTILTKKKIMKRAIFAEIGINLSMISSKNDHLNLKIPNVPLQNYFGPIWSPIKVDGRMIHTVWTILNRLSGWQFRWCSTKCDPSGLSLAGTSTLDPTDLTCFRSTRGHQGVSWTTQNSTSSSYPYFRVAIASTNFRRPVVPSPSGDPFRTKKPWFLGQRNLYQFLSFLKV